MSTTTSILQFSDDISDAVPPVPLPKGPYPFEIVGAVVRVAGTSGNEYVACTCRISADNYPADYTDGDPDGTDLLYTRLLVEDTKRNKYRWRKFMEFIGGPLGREIDLNALIGLHGMCEVTHQEYEGELRAQISKILAP